MTGELVTLRAELTAGLAGQRAELLRWMFLFWIGTVGPLLLAPHCGSAQPVCTVRKCSGSRRLWSSR